MRHFSLFIAVFFVAQGLASPSFAKTATAAPAAARPARGAEDAAQTTQTLAVFDALYQAVRDNYPMPEFVGWQDAWVGEYRAKIAAASTREAAFELMDELVCRLNDYHTRLAWPGKPSLSGPPLRVEPVLAAKRMPEGYGIWGQTRPPLELPALAGVAIAVTEPGQGTGLEAGDEILKVGGVAVREALERAWRHAVGSTTAGRLMSAADRMMLAPAGSELRLTVRRKRGAGADGGGGEETLEKTVRVGQSISEPLIASREAEGVPVIRITHWNNEGGVNLASRFDELLAQWRERPGIIIDVRRNGGGSDDLADEITGRFIKTPVIASFSFRRRVPTQNFEFVVLTTKPRGPWHYEGRVAVLTDEGCMSACEHFVSGMVEAGALTSGTPTNGACGLIRRVDLGSGVRLNVSQTLPIHTGGIPSPDLGIAPHLWAPRRLEDLRAGRDTALEAALGWIKSQAPLPARLQPMTPLAR